MPIKFRCPSCRQTLSVTRRKAGQNVTCPACEAEVRVPDLEAAAAREEVVTAPASAADGERDLGADAVPPPAAPPRAVHTADDEEGGIRFQRRPVEEGGLDMTPMVDVVFQLLIFFMLTCSFSVQKSMQTESPEPDQEGAAQAVTIQEVEADSIIVEIDAENRIKVDGELVASIGMLADVLAAKAAEQPPRTEMLIEADYNAPHGTVVQVTDAGIDANMQHIRRVSRQAED